ncbi:MAG TPA: AGE family epimerase/isomerase [Puia sp.]|nr:AGE family epimerase/isomerase [Puia sp.]
MNTAGYRAEAGRELNAILLYWMENTPDLVHGGFIGRIDGRDQPHPEAPKGLVLNSRILWAFSAAWRSTGESVYRRVADRAHHYLLHNFLDKDHGGAFWSLDAAGQPLDTRKQIYGQAFALYGLSEYYRASGNKTALDEAISLFRLIEQHSFDSGFNQDAGSPRGGYFEAFARDWSLLNDVRLSSKDANDPKTMNTHLHILEAYTNLYQAWPDPLLENRIIGLLDVFDRYIIGAGASDLDPGVPDPGTAASDLNVATSLPHDTAHLGLFFDTNWKSRSHLISYGHDIEASWLLREAAMAINNNEWITKTSRLALRIAAAAAEGLDTDGGLWYEQEDGHLIRQKHWWPQAEAMVGFLQAWQLSGDAIWWQRSLDSWNFIKEHIRSPDDKEWYWGVEADNSPMTGQDKAGFWKCPYHNGRACLEIMRRLQDPAAG